MARRSRKKHVQLSLDRARKPSGRGGWRPGAGRKKKLGSISHDRRATFAAQHPQHVTMRVAAGAPSLARDWLMKIIRRAIRDSHKPAFRIVEFNVLANHLHLICEAGGAEALARGVQGFAVRLVCRLNRALKRHGKLLAHRYHARCLATPTEVRNALRYVLLNRKHHAAEKRFAKYWVDPYSSGPWFAGWAAPLRGDARYLSRESAPTAPATVWLLTAGWRRRAGPLHFDDTPASASRGRSGVARWNGGSD